MLDELVESEEPQEPNNNAVVEEPELNDAQKEEIEKQRQEESRLNKPVRYNMLIQFTIPTILAALIMGGFQLVTQIFASRGIGMEAMAALSYVMPYFTLSMAIGAMLTMGGSALAVKLKGQGNKQKARQIFTLMTLVTLATSLFVAILSYFLRYQILWLFGARGVDQLVIDMSMEFMIPIIWLSPAIMLGMLFTQFIIADGRPTLSMFVSSTGAVATVVLNAIFIFAIGPGRALTGTTGVFGLALSTGVGYAIPAVVGLMYFIFNRNGTLYFTRPSMDFRAVGRSSLNGVGEMLGMLAFTVTTIVKNNVLTEVAGVEAVAAAAIILGLQGLLGAFYFGFVQGVAPLISYNYGKQNHYRTKKLFKKSIVIMGVLSAITLILTFSLNGVFTRIFVDPFPMGLPQYLDPDRLFRIDYFYLREYCATIGDYIFVQYHRSANLPNLDYVYLLVPRMVFNEGLGQYVLYMVFNPLIGDYVPYMEHMRVYCVYTISVSGMWIVGTAFIFMGFNLLASGLFAAFNDGITGGILTVVRTFVFIMVLTLTLPIMWGINGAWIAIPLAEFLSLIMSVIVVIKMGKKYKYLDGVKYKPLVEV